MVIREITRRELFTWNDVHGYQPIRVRQSRPAPPSLLTGHRIGRWSEEEHDLFLDALALHPHGPWSAIARHIPTRNRRQVLSHAQKYRRMLRQIARDGEQLEPAAAIPAGGVGTGIGAVRATTGETIGEAVAVVGHNLTVVITPVVAVDLPAAERAPELPGLGAYDFPIEDATLLDGFDQVELHGELDGLGL